MDVSVWRSTRSVAVAVVASLLMASFGYAARYEHDMNGVAETIWVPAIDQIAGAESGSWHVIIPFPGALAYEFGDTSTANGCVRVSQGPNPFSSCHSTIVVECLGEVALATVDMAGAAGDTVVIKNLPPGTYGIGSKFKYPAGEYRQLILSDGRVLGERTFGKH